MSTAYGDPNSDMAYTWGDDAANDYSRVDDGVRSPTAPGTSDYCNAGANDDNEVAEFGCTEPSISGTVTAVTLYVYMVSGSGTLNGVQGRAYYNGGWQAYESWNVAASAAWYSKSYTGLSIAAASLFPWRVGILAPTMGKSDDLRVHEAYLEVTYTAGGGGTTHTRTLTSSLGSADDQGGASVGQTILLAILFRRALSHALGFSDLVTPAVQQIQSRLVTDLLSTAELLRRTTETRRDVLERVDLGEQQVFATDVLRAIGEQLSFSEASSLHALIARLVMDLAAAGDNFAMSVLRRVTINDSVSLSDLHQHASTLLRELVDDVGLNDGTVREVDVRRMLLELADISDDVVRRRIMGNVLPGDADFASLGPADATVVSAGPGSTGPRSLGPGHVSATPKGSGD